MISFHLAWLQGFVLVWQGPDGLNFKVRALSR